MTAPALVLAMAVAASPVGAQSEAAPCSGGSSFAGTVIVGTFAPGTVKLEWTTWEDASVREYRVSRRPSTCDSASCLTRVAKLQPTGEAIGSKSYTVIDTAPAGAWVYRLDVRRTAGASCTMETAEVLITSPPACDLAALCAQVEASFLGQVIIGNAVPRAIELEWATHAEMGASAYRLSRFNCRVPRDCTAELAEVNATGTCGDVMVHSVTDTLPPGRWTYVLDVLDSAGRTACSLRLPAPASSASSR